MGPPGDDPQAHRPWDCGGRSSSSSSSPPLSLSLPPPPLLSLSLSLSLPLSLSLSPSLPLSPSLSLPLSHSLSLSLSLPLSHSGIWNPLALCYNCPARAVESALQTSRLTAVHPNHCSKPRVQWRVVHATRLLWSRSETWGQVQVWGGPLPRLPGPCGRPHPTPENPTPPLRGGDGGLREAPEEVGGWG